MASLNGVDVAVTSDSLSTTKLEPLKESNIRMNIMMTVHTEIEIEQKIDRFNQ
jgi:hypothetical protein